MCILIGIVLAIIIGGIVALNVWDYRRRSKLTPEQRKQEDEETDFELSIW